MMLLNPCSDPTCTQSCGHKNLNELTEYSFYIGPYAQVTGYEYAVPKCTDTCEHQDLHKLAAATAEGPVSVCVDASAWNSYTGGVMSYEACGPAGAMDLDHCVRARIPWEMRRWTETFTTGWSSRAVPWRCLFW